MSLWILIPSDGGLFWRGMKSMTLYLDDDDDDDDDDDALATFQYIIGYIYEIPMRSSLSKTLSST